MSIATEWGLVLVMIELWERDWGNQLTGENLNTQRAQRTAAEDAEKSFSLLGWRGNPTQSQRTRLNEVITTSPVPAVTQPSHSHVS